MGGFLLVEASKGKVEIWDVIRRVGTTSFSPTDFDRFRVQRCFITDFQGGKLQDSVFSTEFMIPSWEGG